jgi:hypothetical protein
MKRKYNHLYALGFSVDSDYLGSFAHAKGGQDLDPGVAGVDLEWNAWVCAEGMWEVDNRRLAGGCLVQEQCRPELRGASRDGAQPLLRGVGEVLCLSSTPWCTS